MRLAYAALLALLPAAPVLAGSASAVHVGLTVTGNLSPSLAGAWHARDAERGAIYHFVVRGGSGSLYQLVSVPLRGTGMCDLRVGGVIYSLEQTGRKSSYEMQYALRSADVVTSSTDFDDCQEVAAAYLQDADRTQSLILSRTGEGRLIDAATGAEYLRTR